MRIFFIDRRYQMIFQFERSGHPWWFPKGKTICVLIETPITLQIVIFHKTADIIHVQITKSSISMVVI